MILSFTGTREGLTHSQLYSLREYLVATKPDEVHHGCCVGADAIFHNIVCDLSYKLSTPIKIVGHPGPASVLRMTLCSQEFHILHPSKDYSPRNSDIVRDGELLLATPKEVCSVVSAAGAMASIPSMFSLNGGTWQTVRKARMADKTVVIFWPGGQVVVHASGKPIERWSPK